MTSTGQPAAAVAVPAPVRYESLDAFRAVSIFGVVFVHFYKELTLPMSQDLIVLLRARDCTFPVIVLTSVFVMARSLIANPDRTFGRFAGQRFWRLAVPCLVWSSLYWVLWDAGGAWRTGAPVPWPPATLWLSGWIHLWFLPFLFACSLLAFPLVRRLPKRPEQHWITVGCLAAAAVAYGIWSRPDRCDQLVSVWFDGADSSLRIAAGQSLRYAKYIPLGIAAALAADAISRLYASRAVAVIALAGGAAAFTLHVSAAAPALSRMLYSLAIFVVLLGPWTGRALRWLKAPAKYSYAIYILHYAVAQAVLAALGRSHVAPSVAMLLAGSAATFLLSWAAAALVRRSASADWFLPLVPVESSAAGFGPLPLRPERTQESSWPLSPSTSRLRSPCLMDRTSSRTGPGSRARPSRGRATE
jgi:peptidoglycan/LPS O-acetylase OafA/YrhL